MTQLFNIYTMMFTRLIYITTKQFIVCPCTLYRYTGILLKMKLRKLRGWKKKKNDYVMIDLSFLILFPCIFSVFCFTYWTTTYWTRYNNFILSVFPLLEPYQLCYGLVVTQVKVENALQSVILKKKSQKKPKKKLS